MPVPSRSSSPSHLARLISLAPARFDHLPAFRISLGIGVPLLLLLATGHSAWALYAGFGAFTGIYSRYEPTALRFRRQSLMGVVMVACVTLGAGIAQLGEVLPQAATEWIALVIGALVAGGAAVLISVRGIKPAGPLFPLFGIAAVSAAPSVAPFWLAGLIAAASAAFSIGLGLLGHYLGERHPGASAAPALEQFTGAQLRREFTRYTAAALVAGVIGLLSGLPFPYWAQIAAVVPLSAPGVQAQVERGAHRIIGTALGIASTAFILSFPAQPWQLVVWVIILQFLAEMYVLRNYALALLFITPLALTMVQLGHPQPVGPMLQARVLETIIGVAVGVAMVAGRAVWERRRVR